MVYGTEIIKEYEDVPKPLLHYIEKIIAHQTLAKGEGRGQLSRDTKVMERMLNELCRRGSLPVYDFRDFKNHLQNPQQLMIFAAVLQLEESEFLVLYRAAKAVYGFVDPERGFSIERQYQFIKRRADDMIAFLNRSKNKKEKNRSNGDTPLPQTRA